MFHHRARLASQARLHRRYRQALLRLALRCSQATCPASFLRQTRLASLACLRRRYRQALLRLKIVAESVFFTKGVYVTLKVVDVSIPVRRPMTTSHAATGGLVMKMKDVVPVVVMTLLNAVQIVTRYTVKVIVNLAVIPACAMQQVPVEVLVRLANYVYASAASRHWSKNVIVFQDQISLKNQLME